MGSDKPCRHKMQFTVMNGAITFGYLSAFIGSPLWVFPGMALGAYVGYRIEKWSERQAASRATAAGEGRGEG